MKRLPVKFVLLILTLAIYSQAGQYAVANRGQELKNDIPYIRNILFSEKSIGFISRKRGTKKENYFILVRKAASLQSVSKDLFFKSFDYREDIIPTKAQKLFTILKASNGREYKTKNAYCAEFSHETHKLWEKERLLEDHVKPCHSISSVEIVGEQLWLGTRTDGEGKEYDADGIIIISLKDSKLLGKIDKETGLHGNLVRVIRLDPYSGKIWAATGVGLAVINKNHKVETRDYLYEDFDPGTGKPVFYLTSKFKKSILLAVIARQNGVRKTAGYYEAVKKISNKVRSQFTLHLYRETSGIHSKKFLPEEMNVLVPFFIDAANPESDDHTTSPLSFLCSFNDARVLDYFTSIQIKNPFKDRFLHGFADTSARNCIDKYARLDFLDDSYKSKRAAKLLGKEIKALAEIRSGHAHSNWGSTKRALEAATSLKQMGDIRGFSLLEEHLASFDLKKASVDNGYLEGTTVLYTQIVSQLSWPKEITSTILNGIKKGFLYGCRYFDTSNETLYGKHLDAKYAGAIVIAMDLADERPHYLPLYWTGREIYSPKEINKLIITDPCAEAFTSQVRNETIKKDFIDNYYPKLTNRQKELADRLISGQYQPDVEKIRRKLREQIQKKRGGAGIAIRVFPRPRP